MSLWNKFIHKKIENNLKIHVVGYQNIYSLIYIKLKRKIVYNEVDEWICRNFKIKYLSVTGGKNCDFLFYFGETFSIHKKFTRVLWNFYSWTMRHLLKLKRNWKIVFKSFKSSLKYRYRMVKRELADKYYFIKKLEININLNWRNWTLTLTKNLLKKWW